MQTGAVISAEVVDVNGDYVVVNAGLKSESEIPATQFRNADGAVSVQVGDFVEVAIEALEDGFWEYPFIPGTCEACKVLGDAQGGV